VDTAGSNESVGSIKEAEVLDSVGDYQVLEDSAL
jgi:hypothetical protein